MQKISKSPDITLKSEKLKTRRKKIYAKQTFYISSLNHETNFKHTQLSLGQFIRNAKLL